MGVKSNDMPLSIIIVGVGKADFAKMDILDADDNPMTSTWGEKARRDIVRFVPYREFRNKPVSELARCVLEEVPGQLLSYFKMRGIVSNPPKPEEPMPAELGRPMPQEQQHHHAAPPPYGSQYPVSADYAAG